MNLQLPVESAVKSLAQVWKKLQQPGLLTTLIRGAGTVFVIQSFSVGITYSTQICLARWMGASEYGLYESMIAIGTSFAFLAGLGSANAILRFIPEYSVKQDWAKLKGIIRCSWWQTCIASLIIAIVGTLLTLWLGWQTDSYSQSALILGLWLVPLVSLMKLQLEMGRASRKIVLAYVPSLLITPVLMIGAAFLWMLWQGSLEGIPAIVLMMVVMLLVVTVQSQLFRLGLSSEVRQTAAIYAIQQWLFVSLPLLLIDGSFMLLKQTDVLMLGLFLNPKEVGIYSAAFRTAEWVNFILASVNAIAAPLFASLYVQGNRDELQRLVSTIARWMFYPALTIAIGLIVFADPILGLFGKDFIAAKPAMIALIAGQLINVGAGSVGYLLMMTGHHFPCAAVVSFSALMNVGLNLVGIPRLGVLGAGLATAFSMALWNIWLNRLVVKYLGINPSIVAAWRNRVEE